MFDESLTFRKIPPVIQAKPPEINGRPVELRPRAPDTLDPRVLRRRTWNREEVRDGEGQKKVQKEREKEKYERGGEWAKDDGQNYLQK